MEKRRKEPGHGVLSETECFRGEECVAKNVLKAGPDVLNPLVVSRPAITSYLATSDK